MSDAAPHLTPEQVHALGEELDALRQRIVDDLGTHDVSYIRRVMRVQRALEATGRGLLFFSALRLAWLGGVFALSLAKILDNMEIGHNVMHGQYDWTRDPALSGSRFEWDNVCPADQWRHSHNYRHHMFTNVVGLDRDIGFAVLRLSPQQRWRPYHLGNVLYALLLALFFQYGVALHDLETELIATGRFRWSEKRGSVAEIWRKLKQQTLKDYVVFPVLAGPSARRVLAANAAANAIRNLWAFTIIICGHFPEGTCEFSEEEIEGETRDEWYLRQLVGSCNIEGGKLLHILSGNLSHHIEHHLYPDLPARRYAELGVSVRDICARYEVPYHSGRLHRLVPSVIRKLVRLSYQATP